MNRLILLLMGACTLGAGGCDDIFGARATDVGELTLQYDGHESGLFSARGARAPDWQARSHAAGLRIDSPRTLHVFAYSLGPDGVSDQFFLSGSVSRPGTYPISSERIDGSIYAELALDVPRGTSLARAIYVLTSGTLILESERSGRVRGRFEGTARLLDGVQTIQIRDGRFDVPNNLPRPVE